jgi:hypothetical protein
MMKVVLALALGSAAAFVSTAPQTALPALEGAREDLIAFAESNTDQLGANLGFWDPLGCTKLDFFGLEQSGRLPAGATIGYLRHAEIKHSRVAMAAFVGYCIQAQGQHFPWLPYRGFEEGLTPPEQWDAMPGAAKWQFFVAIGILEAMGEVFPAGQHYMTGGRPGVYPSLANPSDELAASGAYPPHPVLDLWDPLGFMQYQSAESKERRLRVEINNGRLAMLGIFSLISEAKVPGAVPFLAGKIPNLPDLEIMGPFVGTDGAASIW